MTTVRHLERGGMYEVVLVCGDITHRCCCLVATEEEDRDGGMPSLCVGVMRWTTVFSLVPRPHPASHCLQYNEKLGVGLGTGLHSVSMQGD